MLKNKKDVDAHVQRTLQNVKTPKERADRGLAFAKLYCGVGEYGKALEYVRTYIGSNNEDFKAYNVLGQCYEKLNQPAKALESYQKSLDIQGNQRDVLLKVGNLLTVGDAFNRSAAERCIELAEKVNGCADLVTNLRLKIANNYIGGGSPGLQTIDILQQAILSHPCNIQPCIRLLEHYIRQGNLREGFQFALSTEVRRNEFLTHSLDWYDQVADLLCQYENNPEAINDWEYYVLCLVCCDRRASLFLKMKRRSERDNNALVRHIIELDQQLFKLEGQLRDTLVVQAELFNFCLDHFRGQLLLHMTSLLLHREQSSQKQDWKAAVKNVLPLMLLAYRVRPSDSNQLWVKHCSVRSHGFVLLWAQEAAFRSLQLGRTIWSCIPTKAKSQYILHDSSKTLWHDGNELIKCVREICVDKNWRLKLYHLLFADSEPELKHTASHFKSSPKFLLPYYELPNSEEFADFAKNAQSLYPNDLSHQVYIFLANDNRVDMKLHIMKGLKLSTQSLSYCAPEALNLMDVYTYLYAVAIQAGRQLEVENIELIKPIILPYANMSASSLCSSEQESWWLAAYRRAADKTDSSDNAVDIRSLLQRGIEAVRGVETLRGNDCPKPDIFVALELGSVLADRISKSEQQAEKTSFGSRAEAIFRLAVKLLKDHQNGSVEGSHKSYFYYLNSEYSLNNDNLLERVGNAIVFLSERYFKRSDYEEFIKLVAGLELPMAAYLESEAYRKLCEDSKISKQLRSRYMRRQTDMLEKTRHLLQTSREHHYLLSVVEEKLKRAQSPTAQNESIITDDIESEDDAFFTNNRSRRDDSRRYGKVQHHFEIEGHIRSLSYTVKNVKSDIDDIIKPELHSMRREILHVKEDIMQLGLNPILREISCLKDKLNSLDEALKKLHISEFTASDLAHSTNPNVLVPFNATNLLQQQLQLHQLAMSYAASPAGSLMVPPTNSAGCQLRPPTLPMGYQQPYIPQGTLNFSPITPQNTYSPYQVVGQQMPMGNINLSASQEQHVNSAPINQHLNKSAPLIPPIEQNLKVENLNISGTQVYTPPQSFNKVNKNQLVEQGSPAVVVITSSDPLPKSLGSQSSATVQAQKFSVTIPPEHINHNQGSKLPHLISNKSVSSVASTGVNFSFKQFHGPSVAPPSDSVFSFKPESQSNSMVQNTSSTYTFAPRVTPNVATPPLNLSNDPKKNILQNIVRESSSSERDGTTESSSGDIVDVSEGSNSSNEKNENNCSTNIINTAGPNQNCTPVVQTTLNTSNIHNISAAFKPHNISNKIDSLQPVPSKPFNFSSKDAAQPHSPGVFEGKDQSLESSNSKAFSFKGACIEGTQFKAASTTAAKAENSENALKGLSFKNLPANETQSNPANITPSNSECSKDSPFSFSKITTTVAPQFKIPHPNVTLNATNPSEPVKQTAMFSNFTFNQAGAGAKPFSFNSATIPGGSNYTFAALVSKEQGGNVTPIKSLFGNIGNETPFSTPMGFPKNEKREDVAANKSDGEDDYEPTAQFQPVIPLPDLVEANTGEEDEIVLFEHRAKLLRFDLSERSWKDRGVGNIKLLQNKNDTNSVRLVMRREQVHKLCCNQRIAKDMQFTYISKSETALSWAGHDFSEEKLTTELLCARFKTQATCNAFRDAILEAQKKMTDGTAESVEVAKIAEERTTQNVEGFGDKFKSKVGSWSCEKCYLSNVAETLYCAACEAPKDAAVPKKITTVSSSQEAPTFSFGFNNNAVPISSSSATNLSLANQNSNSNLILSAASVSNSEVCVSTKPSINFGFKSSASKKAPSSDDSKCSDDLNENEDNDILFKRNAVLCLFTKSGWKQHASGNVKVLRHKKSGFLKVVVYDQESHIRLDHVLDESIVYKLRDKKSWQFEATDVTESTEKDNVEHYAIQFETQADAVDFLHAVKHALSGAIQNSRRAQDKTQLPLTLPELDIKKDCLSNDSILRKSALNISNNSFGNTSFGGSKMPETAATEDVKIGNINSRPQNASQNITTGTLLGTQPSNEISEKPTQQSFLFGSTNDNKKSLFGQNSSLIFGGPVKTENKSIFGAINEKTLFGSTAAVNKNNSFKSSSIFGANHQFKNSKPEPANTENKLTSPSFFFSGFAANASSVKPVKQISFGTPAATSTNDASSQENAKQSLNEFDSFAAKAACSIDFASLAATGKQGGFEKPASGFFGLKNQDAFKNFRTSTTTEKEENEAADNDNSNAAEDENYDPYYEPIIALPDEVSINTGEEEEEKLFGKRGLLYRFDSEIKEWKQRGTGEIKILYHPTKKTFRMVMRREQILKLVLNFPIVATLSLSPMGSSTTSFAFGGLNFAESSEGELEKLAVRFKKDDEAQEFLNHIKSSVDAVKKSVA